MPDREKYIEVLSKTVKTVKEFNEDTPIKISLQCVEDILELLKESVPQGVVNQIRWERNTALAQLEQIGKGLGSKMDDIVAMLKEQEGKPLRCKTCTMRDKTGFCHRLNIEVKDDDYCSFGAWKGC